MKITELISPESVRIGVQVKNKKEMLSYLSELMFNAKIVTDRNKFEEALNKREEQSTTAVGDGIAVPHAKNGSVAKAGIGAVLLKNGIDYGAEDGDKSRLFFVIAAPDGGENIHLDALGRLSTMLMNEEFTKALMAAKNKDEFLKIIKSAEKDEETAKNTAAENSESTDRYDIVAVTACPTGIAHTFMAAEGLENAAKKLGVKIKVEKNGASGVKDRLTKEDIEYASSVIVAADRKVEMARFDGKPMIMTKVSDGINNAEKLIEKAMDKNTEIYRHNDSVSEGLSGATQGKGLHSVYTDLMNGVSYMLPFVIGGGILIAIAFLLDDYSIDPANFGMNTPLAAFFKTVGGAAFGFMLPVLAGYIAMSIADRPALAAGFAGGYLAEQGGSGFLGALLAGFIAGYVLVGLKKALDKLPESLAGIKSVLLYPLLSILITAAVIQFILNPPVSALNAMLYRLLDNMGNSSRVLLGIVLAGMMAVDMGGPINKAAYVFGTASIAENRFDIMAAVMIGGMVPPIAIALCSTFFKSRFSSRERKSAAVNYVMGLSFITEGAIPFAAADPLRVIPSCAVGAAVAGGLSMFFNCTLRAPHGGIFVIPVIGNWIGFLISLAIGSVVGMLMLALLKKPMEE
ncbi:fructose-specific PTS transporter subunit EIIC [Lachnospiraceae bacterium NSJ-143]|nr:fructose-specific PTS transporter subunit EIIC [Lachnospiraceae bacterium NSJ-143]